MAAVNIIEVNKYYDEHIILNDINLHIEKGEFVAIVGPSGSGKSTLLRLVAGLDTLSNGRILINDQCVNATPASKRNMAMVFQNYALYPHMTVYANMAYGLKMRGMKKPEIEQRVRDASALLQIQDYLHRKPTELSGGQRQRVAMGRAMVRSPAVFLFDEPLSNLDAKLRTEMRHEIKKLHQQLQTTCIYVTHDQTEAMTLADRIVVLNKGMIEQVGSPYTLYNYPASLFVAGFIGYYQMNFIPAHIDFKGQKLITQMGLKLPLPEHYCDDANESDVILGIRPEHLYLKPTSEKPQFSAKIELIDDMGADKLVSVITDTGQIRLNLRVILETVPNVQSLSIGFDMDKAHLFCASSGKRIGGLSEQKTSAEVD